MKCQREAMDLLHHYYYASRAEGDGGDGGGDNDDDAAPSTSTSSDAVVKPAVPLSLEEELALLRNGAVADDVLARGTGGGASGGGRYGRGLRSPFAVHDAGIRGVVCIVSRIPGSAMIPYDEVTAGLRAAAKVAMDAAKAERREREGEEGEEGETKKVKHESIETVAPSTEGEGKAAANKDISDEGKEKEGETKPDQVDNPETTPVSEKSTGEDATSTLWDPVETVRQILGDVRSADQDYRGCDDADGADDEEEETMESAKDGTDAPGSRFITRAIPMQVTCFASIEEITLVINAMLERFLVPNVDGAVPSDDKDSANKKEGDDSKEGEKEGAKNDEAATKSRTTTTFKIEFKRRNCTHLSRDKVIDAVAPLVINMGTNKSSPFAVNLVDPDYIIRFEVCRTLCGISILPRQKWYKNFNLVELREASAP